MAADVQYVHECPVMGRGLVAGAGWGAPLGIVILAAVSWSFPLHQSEVVGFGAAGAVVGGLIGLVSGLVLAVAEHPDPGGVPVQRTTRQRRRTAFITAALPFWLIALLTTTEPPALPIFLGVAAVSGTAGALLAPWVVRGPRCRR